MILDDESFRTFQTFGVEKNLVLADPKKGLTDADIERAIMVLSGEPVKAYDRNIF